MKNFWATNQIDNTTAEILIYGYIGDAVNAGDFVRELKQLELCNSTINIRINSGGGSIFEGLGIFNAIRNSKANIDGYIDGIAASMASVIAMGCKKVYMSKAAMFMTHRASGISAGNANDMRTYATMMEGLENIICSIYAAKTGLSQDDAKSKYLNGDDNWFTAEAALQEKIIDGIYDAPEAVTTPTNVTDPQKLVDYFNTTMHLDLKTLDNYMKQFTLTAVQLAVLNLPENADTNAVVTAINALHAEATTLTGKVKSAEASKKKAEDDLKLLQDTTVKNEVESILDKALNVDKKITKEVSNQLKAAYATNPTGLKALVDAMPAFVSVTSQLKGDVSEELKNKTWDELDKAGLLPTLKEKDFELLKTKYKERFGTDYSG